ncbi:MAG TPA: MBL fold metallo-hydrolase [bacterium]|nr:MBL fold metallo-hydrolase [bacterium]HOL47174.1 MBL fold metallo-hydrolase [bacterium]HPQ17667.1 MBL fold metallo-hydrolase [bacterium]
MKLITLIVGPLETNCYILVNEKNEAIIIDPGAETKKIISQIEKENFQPKVILLTHTHFDHIGAVYYLQKKYSIPFYFSREEEEHYKTQKENAKLFFYEDLQLSNNYSFISEGKYQFINFNIEVIATPGHTIGSLCYYFYDNNIIFTGDTLFHNSYGRTDLPTGNFEQLVNSIKKKLFLLPDETIIYPGHCEISTIGEEKNYLSFL